MSNGPSTPINLTRVAPVSAEGGHQPIPGSGEAAKKDAIKYRPVTEHTVTKRTIPVTGYKPADAPDVESAAKETTPAADAKQEPTRHEKWKAAQEKKRAKREAERTSTLEKRQGLAGVLLKKGDLVGAAKALNIPVSEMVALVNNGAMGIKPEETAPKQLTPQEQFDADRTAFRAEMKAFRDEQAAERNTRAMTGFIEKTIRPVIGDKDAYEMIHAAGVEDIEAFAYKYMNEHYYETSEKDDKGNVTKAGEILDAKVVLDEIEQSLLDEATKTAERGRAVKKLSKYYAPASTSQGADGGKPVAQTLGGDAGATEDREPSRLSASWQARVQQAMAEEAAERAAAGASAAEGAEPEEEPKETPIATKNTGPIVNLRAGKLNGGRLTISQRLADSRDALAQRR